MYPWSEHVKVFFPTPVSRIFPSTLTNCLLSRTRYQGSHDTNYVLDYKNGNYLESIFDLDFQYYPETKDSYLKLWHEGQRALASFKRLRNIKLTEKEANNKTDYKVREKLSKEGFWLTPVESLQHKAQLDSLY